MNLTYVSPGGSVSSIGIKSLKKFESFNKNLPFKRIKLEKDQIESLSR